MVTHACDICHKKLTVKKVDLQLLDKYLYKHFEFCANCATDLVQKIADNKLIKKTELEQFTSVKTGATL